jgi:pSer/pThr/pTyr-binding forkhead associated (FHA) protein
VTKTAIHEVLWPGTFVSDATVVGLIKEVRRAFGDAHGSGLIRTVHSVGYAFTGTPRAESATAVPATTTHWLVVGDRRIALQAGPNLIGRDPQAAVWLDVPGVSRRHAQIALDSGGAILEDLGSKNGTLLGDKPVRGPMLLRNADRIQIAAEVMVFHESTSGMSTATQPVAPQKLHRTAT